MLKKSLHTLLLLFLTVGVIFPNLYSSIFDTLVLGTTSFPTSLDTLTNPSASDSVLTVSHSSQHSNANDAIEALEAKLGIGASTAVANSIFVGTGAGTSLWTTYATATNMSLSGALGVTGLGTFGTLLSQGSSTIVGDFRLPSLSQGLLYAGSGGLVSNTATNTASCSGSVSCSSFEVLSSGAISIVGAAAQIESSYATTSGTANLYKQFDLEATETLLFWGSVSFSGTTPSGQTYVHYRPSNGATTTVMHSDGTPGDDSVNGFGYYVATTTVSVTVHVSPGDSSSLTSIMGIIH